MFITIPLILIGASIVGMVIIVRRKMPYLRKLSPEAHDISDNILEDFFPELINWFRQIPWRQYRQSSLQELEKGLRRMRLAFLKIDHASARLIQKVRHTHLTTELEHKASVEAEEAAELMIPENMSVVVEPTPEDLKGQEQQLIVEIAQDPKNAALYDKLGDLYLKMGSDQDAREAFEAGLGFDPNNQSMARKYSTLLKKLESTN
jgi:tetratricopeptide (TPR) repeat protein